MLQVRITNPDGSNPVILENAENVSVSKTVSSNKESGTFTIAKNDPKAYVVNPDIDGYVKFWEVWDTKQNRRLNRGPIHSIEDSAEGNWVVEGPGRSQFLADLIGTRNYFNAKIGPTIDDLRYENISIQPKTETLIHEPTNTAGQNVVFGIANVNEKYYGLSKKTKDYVLNGNYGINLRPGETRLPLTYWRASEYWAGTGTMDSLIVDLGDNYLLSRVNVGFPWWPGLERSHNNRTYDFYLDYATDDEATLTYVQGRSFGPFHNLLSKPSNQVVTGAGGGFSVYQDVTARYLRVKITGVHAWYGNAYDNIPADDGYAFNCDPNYVPGSKDYQTLSNTRTGHMAGKSISDTILEPQNDCYASILNLDAYTEVIPVSSIEPLGIQRIDNESLQIMYHHSIQSSEITRTSEGFKRYEPGSTFRRLSLSWSGASGSYTKFFADDCSNCYPDNFGFGIVDQNNSLVYSTDDDSGSASLLLGAYTSYVMTKGGTPTFTSSDSWPAKTDALSWGASYSYTEVTGDYATINFRGRSFRWYATIPDDATPAIVSIEIRSRNDTTGVWSSWTTLEASKQLPDGISSEPVYEITYESGHLVADKSYEIRITNLGGFCSIDSIEGYWEGSVTTYNEDALFQRFPDSVTQIYDSRFTNGSAVKWNGPSVAQRNWAYFSFTGDRVIVVGAKGHNYGTMRIQLSDYSTGNYDDGTSLARLFIPGGNADGSLSVDLNTGKRGGDIAQAVIFDSKDYFTSPGLPWKTYNLSIGFEDAGTFSTTTDALSDNFVERCHNCSTPTGTATTVRKFVYLDSVIAHDVIQLSAKFQDTTQGEIISSIAEVLQMEWDVNEQGLDFKVRIGTDTNEVLREGQNTLVDWNIANDGSEIASILLSSGADIDGLPLSAITEDRRARKTLQRTVMRKQDYRDVADYFQLIGLSRGELKRRRKPTKRITVTHIANSLDLDYGDSFTLYTKKMGSLRVRIVEIQIAESSSGRIYTLECERWPKIPPTDTYVPTSVATLPDLTTTVEHQLLQAQAKILAFGSRKFTWAMADIKARANKHWQAEAFIIYSQKMKFQAQGTIKAKGNKFTQAQADIKAVGQRFMQATALLDSPHKVMFMQAQAVVTDVLFLDTFSRTTTSPPFDIGASEIPVRTWNFSDFDTAWTIGNNTAYVDGSTLIVGSGTGETFDSFSNSGATMENGQFTMDFLIPASGELRWDYRWYDEKWNVKIRADRLTNHTLKLEGADVVVSGAMPVRNTWYTVKAIVNNTSSPYVQAKVWPRSTPEPFTLVPIQTSWPSLETGIFEFPILDVFLTPDNQAALFDNIRVGHIILPHGQYMQAQAFIEVAGELSFPGIEEEHGDWPQVLATIISTGTGFLRLDLTGVDGTFDGLLTSIVDNDGFGVSGMFGSDGFAGEFNAAVGIYYFPIHAAGTYYLVTNESAVFDPTISGEGTYTITYSSTPTGSLTFPGTSLVAVDGNQIGSFTAGSGGDIVFLTIDSPLPSAYYLGFYFAPYNSDEHYVNAPVPAGTYVFYLTASHSWIAYASEFVAFNAGLTNTGIYEVVDL